MSILINIKSGTGGYYNYDGCDLCLREIKNKDFPIPRIGESIDILENDDNLKEYHQYLVSDVRYWIADNSYGVTIYVLPIGRNVDIL